MSQLRGAFGQRRVAALAALLLFTAGCDLVATDTDFVAATDQEPSVVSYNTWLYAD